MPPFFLPNLHCHSVKFSPFFPNKVAVTACQHFGFTGGGSLILLAFDQKDVLQECGSTKWSNAMFDLVWSESCDNLIATASGDGTVQVWNINNLDSVVALFDEHSLEVQSVDWNKNHMVSGSWDGTVKLWDPQLPKSNRTCCMSSPIHSVAWSPLINNIFGCTSADGKLRIWDTSVPGQISHANVYTEDILSCAWNRHDSNIIMTGGSDCTIKGWDMHNVNRNLFKLTGCEKPIKKVQCSPHDRSVVASVSYDLLTRVWDWQAAQCAQETVRHHSEFVYGLDFSKHTAGLMADCGWDSLVHVFHPKFLKER